MFSSMEVVLIHAVSPAPRNGPERIDTTATAKTTYVPEKGMGGGRDCKKRDRHAWPTTWHMQADGSSSISQAHVSQ